ncbi:ribonuclease H-like domain-containing protein [Tanacetum coccineum]
MPLFMPFLSTQPQGSQLVHEDLEQIHDDDLEEMDLKWNMALLSMRARKFYQRTRRKIVIDGSSTAGYDKSKAMCAIDGGRFYWSDMAEDEVQANMDLMAFTDSESLLTSVLMRTGLKTVKNAKPLSTARSVNTVRPVSTARPNVNTVSQDQGGFNDVKAFSMLGVENLSNPKCGCSRHMSGNIAHLSEFKEFDGGYVTFGGGANGGRITGKGTIKTDKLDFEDVYFVKELKFNLFSVSQMCDKKNYVLFTDSECLVLSPNFKLPDESQVLLKIPQKETTCYAFINMKNIVPKDDLTCLVAKATSEESMLWHKRLGHVNFKNINKLVKDNLVRDLPLKREKGIKREYSVARTPQQNGVAERKNRTLIEAARTMVLVVKPHNKTPYELFKGIKPAIGFMKPFGCHVTILNTLDKLGKFDGKSDEGIQEGESSISSQQDQDCIFMPIWKDASYFEDVTLQSVDDVQLQDQDGNHDDCSFQDDGIDDQQVNTASPQVNTGSRELSTADSEVNTATSEGLMGPIPTTEDSQEEGLRH